MSRQARQRSLTGIYHVIQRGLNHMAIFLDDDDKQMFLKFLKIQTSDSFRVYCYCLMDNHIHLLVKSNTLSSSMQRLNSLYALWFNQKYQRTGYLFQDRFKSEVIEDENYLLSCFRYILQNPIKAGICDNVSTYRWNSYPAYFNPTPSFIYTGFISLFFDTQKDLEAYLEINQDIPFIDIDINQHKKVTDQEAQEILNQKLNGKRLTELSSDHQKRILKEIKNTTSIGIRQLARITSFSFHTIRNL